MKGLYGELDNSIYKSGNYIKIAFNNKYDVDLLGIISFLDNIKCSGTVFINGKNTVVSQVFFKSDEYKRELIKALYGIQKVKLQDATEIVVGMKGYLFPILTDIQLSNYLYNTY